MFRNIRRILQNANRRGRIARTRMLLALRWARRQASDVQRAIVLDLLCMFVGITWTVLSESNKPARYTFIPIMLIGAYIARKLAVPVWFGELGLVAYRRTTDLLPKWARDLVRRSDERQTGAVPHDIHSDAIWHDVSLGGHIFHILGTVWMWLHVVLYACGWLPVWKSDWLSIIVMATLFILLFVWTEDFVTIKKWRTRLAWVIGTHIAVMLVIMIAATAAPGRFNHWAAKFGYSEAIEQTDADARNIQKVADAAELKDLLKTEAEYRSAYRKHLHDAAGRLQHFDADWSQAKSDDWPIVAKQIKDVRQPEEEASEGWTTTLTDLPTEHPLWLVIGGLVILAGLGGASSGTAKSH